MIICPKKEKKNSGQALIVILLVSAVGLTLGLSLASRATEDTNITTEIEESTRAFSAAEAGLEESAQYIGEITAPGSSYKGSLGNAKYEVTVREAGGTKEPYQFPGKVKNNQNITVWLVGHNGDEIDLNDKYSAGGIDICWGGGDSDPMGLELTLIYDSADSGEPNVKRQTYNPSSGGNIIEGAQAAPRNASANCGGGDYYTSSVALNFKKDMEPAGSEGNTRIFLKIRPVGDDGDDKTSLAIAPQDGAELKTQGEEHISVGTTDSGQTTKLVQFISHPIPPEMFDFVLYSKSGIEK